MRFLGLLLAAILVGHHPHPEVWVYKYVNQTQSQQIYVGKSFFDSLVREHWCVKVYTAVEDHHKVQVCVI